MLVTHFVKVEQIHKDHFRLFYKNINTQKSYYFQRSLKKAEKFFDKIKQIIPFMVLIDAKSV